MIVYCLGSRPAMYYWWDENEVPGCTCEEDHCVIINRNKEGEYRWKTTRCNSSHHHLCMGDEKMECVHEKPSVPTSVPDTAIQTTEFTDKIIQTTEITERIIQTTMTPDNVTPSVMSLENDSGSTLSGRHGMLGY